MPRVEVTARSGQRSRCHCWFAAFFAFGAMMCALTLLLLLFPGGTFDWLWRLNPEAQLAFQSLGRWSLLLMLTVGAACLMAAIGLWRGKSWGTRLALIILSVNVVGDIVNSVFRHDYRTLVGLPVGAAMIFLLVRSEDCSKDFPSQTKGE